MSDARGIVDANGRPVRRQPKSDACPQCRAGKDQRVKSGGFGTPHDVCGNCGFEDFEEDAE